MHKHDLDLMAEYAAGSLEDATEARSRIESCDVCAEEYRGQMAVLAELGGVGSAAMNDLECAQIRRDIWTELRRSPAVSPVPAGAAPWWRSWALGAAAFVVVAVALIGVMENFAGSGDATATFSETGAGLDSGEPRSLDDSDAGGAEEAETVTTNAADGQLSADSYEGTPFALIAREVRSRSDAEDPGVFSSDEEGLSCLEESGLDEHELVDGVESMTDLLVAVASDEELSTATIWFVDPDACTVVHIED